MVIDALDRQGINIKDVTVQLPKRDKHFDPERDITDIDWQGMVAELQNYGKKKDFGKRWEGEVLFSRMSANMKLLRPEKIEDIKWDPSDKDILIKEINQNAHFSSFIDYAASYKILYPDEASNYIQNPEAYQKMVPEIRDILSAFPQEGSSLYAADFLIFYPNKAEEIGVNDEYREKCFKRLEELRAEKDWGHFAQLASNMRLLFPQQFRDIILDGESWEGMRRDLDRYRYADGSRVKEKYYWFSRQAKFMMILAAHEAKITGKGIEITMRKAVPEFAGALQPLPEARKF